MKQTSIIVKFLFAFPAVISSYGERIRAEKKPCFTQYEIYLYSKTLQYLVSHVLES